MNDDFAVRLVFLLIGLFIGWAGATAKMSLQLTIENGGKLSEMRQQIHELRHPPAEKEERGAARLTVPWLIFLFIFGIVLYSVIQTSSTNNRLLANEERDGRQQRCTEQFLGNTVQNINIRTRTSPEVTKLNRQRVGAQERLFDFFVDFSDREPSPEEMKKFQRVVLEYDSSLEKYSDILEETEQVREMNPYPTVGQFRECLRTGKPLPPPRLQSGPTER